MTRVWQPKDRDAEGFLPIEGYGVIGNGRTLALVGCDGSIDWAPLPRVDSPSVFARLLDAERGGYWQLAPVEPWTATRAYLDDTNVLCTTFTTETGVVELLDLMPSMAFGSDLGLAQTLWNGMLLRFVRGVSGHVRMRQLIAPAFDYAREQTSCEVLPGHGAILCSLKQALRVVCATPLEVDGGRVHGVFDVRHGEGYFVAASYHAGGAVVWSDLTMQQATQLLERELEGWRRWISRCEYVGPYQTIVRRSMLALKLLDYLPSGAKVAAATTSLPEGLRGVRNWDYRYSWIRDTSYALHAAISVGYRDEAEGFLQWVIDVTKDDPSALQIMYRVDGGQDLDEFGLPHLSGYKHSRPVRVGNAAYLQRQLDRYGEVVDGAYVHRRFGGVVNGALWEYVVAVVQQVLANWRRPDAGLWEVRSAPRRMTYSNVMCWVALDRAIKLAQLDQRDAPLDDWRATRDEMRHEIMAHCVSPQGYFTQSFDSDVLDASALSFPLRGFVEVDDPIMRATIDAVERELTRDGLVRRYQVAEQDENVDGLPGREGRFLLCSCWLVDCLIGLSELDRAQALLDSVLARANDLGLLSEEIDATTGALLGNFPQAFSHFGVINAIVNLARARGDGDHRLGLDFADITGAIPGGPERRRMTGQAAD